MKNTRLSTSKKSGQKLSAKNAKKVSIKDIVEKTKDLLKKPFSRKETRELAGETKKKKRSTSNKQTTQNVGKEEHSLTLKEVARSQISKKQHLLEDQRLDQSSELMNEDEDQLSTSNDLFAQASSEVNGFFYTNDKFFNRVEDGEMLRYLQRSYPLFMRNPSDLTTQKKQILEMLQNAKFMEDFLSYYDMSIYDFFKYLFRIEPDIFKGSFLIRVQKAMRYKKYALDARKTTHFERKRARLKTIQANQSKSRKG